MTFKKTPRTVLVVLAALLVLSCGGPADRGSGASSDDDVTLALMVAQEYVDGYFDQYPEEASMNGYPNPPLDRFGDHSPAALAAWHAREDAWLETLRGIDPTSLEGTEAAVPYAFVLEQLEASRDLRICRFELWTVNPTGRAGRNFFPWNSPTRPWAPIEARAAVLARARDVARFIDTEIANLREGLSEGYVAPRSGVEAVLDVTDGLLEGPIRRNRHSTTPRCATARRSLAASLLSVIDQRHQPGDRSLPRLLEH